MRPRLSWLTAGGRGKPSPGELCMFLTDCWQVAAHAAEVSEQVMTRKRVAMPAGCGTDEPGEGADGEQA